MPSIQQLRYAAEVERTGSISKAAENLYMNQPNLSKSIRDLEAELGVVVFARTGRGVIPTEKGREFLLIAHEVLEQMARMEALYRPAADAGARFDVCVPRASYVSAAFTAFVRALGPDAAYRIGYREDSAAHAIRSVVDGVCNIAVVRYDAEFEAYFLSALNEHALRSEPVCTFSYRALMSRTHPLADSVLTDGSELSPYTEIRHGDWTVPSLPAAEARKRIGQSEGRRSVSIYERGSQFELLCGVPGAYMWVSPMPKEVLARFSLVQKTCESPKSVHKDILISRKGWRYTDEERLFLEKLTESARSVGAD